MEIPNLEKPKPKRKKKNKLKNNSESSLDGDGAEGNLAEAHQNASSSSVTGPSAPPEQNERVSKRDEAVPASKKRNRKKKVTLPAANSIAEVREAPQVVASELDSAQAASDSTMSPLLYRSRQENNFNLATEENHSNIKNETSGLGNSSAKETPSKEADSKKQELPAKLERSKNDLMESRECQKTVATQNATEEKSKAELKAERKAAFEAQRLAQIETNKEEKANKSKAELKAERRALQEAQRAGKENVPKPELNKVQLETMDPVVAANKSKSNSPEKSIPKKASKKTSGELTRQQALSRKLRLFSHLSQHVASDNLTKNFKFHDGAVHPAVVCVGLQTSQGIIRGSNARCVSTLAALRRVIEEYSTPLQKELSRDLDEKLQVNLEFLRQCRPLSVSTTNALKKLRFEISQVPSSKTDEEAKTSLLDVIDTFINEDVNLAKTSICQCAGKKILNGDVILVYAHSSLVKQVLIDAFNNGKKFRVIVVDSRPGLEGRELLASLVRVGIPCTYIWINAISYVMKEVKKVILGCHSLQANGCVVSRVGSSQVALVAHASNVPVLVCCETYKFCERVHTDSFVYNELGDPNKLLEFPRQKALPQETPFLNLVSLTYDVMPSHLVTSVITELEMLPCTSVPVVLRVKHLSHQL